METEHDLDFIAVHPNKKFKIGIEMKNTLSIIPLDEIDVKIKICDFLGIVPVFAVRWLKPYFYCIRNQGGFCWMFKTQFYPLGFDKQTTSLCTKLSDPDKTDSTGCKLEFPINVGKELPPNHVKIFEEWVEKNKDDPPKVNIGEDTCTK